MLISLTIVIISLCISNHYVLHLKHIQFVFKNKIANKPKIKKRCFCKIQKNEVGSLSYTIHKRQLQMDYRLKHKTRTYKTPKENIEENLYDIGLVNDFINMVPKAQ